MFGRYFIIITFKGTNYKGWQSQPGSMTIQGIISDALRLLLKEEISLTGAGRTDSGVHAINYIAHFDSHNNNLHLKSDLKHKLNSILPYDIYIQDIIKVDNTSHARFDAVSRTYHYVITRYKNPFLQDFSYHVFWDIDVNAMNKGCQILIQHKDFTSFSKLHSNNKTNYCTISEAEWREIPGGLIVLRITANRFLRGMVRAITGTMLDIGRGKIPYEEIEQVLLKKDRSEAGMTAKAKGLFLTKIRYNEQIQSKILEESESPIQPVSALFF